MKFKESLICAAVALVSPAAIAAMSCESLIGVTLMKAQVTAATSITSPITVTSPAGTATVSVPFCRVEGVARPSPVSEILFEVWLPPTRGAWNGRLKMEATGGYLGGIPYPRMAQQLALGSVETGSNLGHQGGESASWAMVPEKVNDYGYRANYYVASAAKAVTAAFYGEPAKYSYFDGCSGGGRQAHMVAQRFPELFDGILAGAPSMFYPDVILEINWQSRLQFPTASRFPNDPVLPAQKLGMISEKVMEACDDTDGLVDGQITNPLACSFDPGTLQCTAGDGPSCLTAEQVDMVREWYRGAHRTDGTPLWAGPPPGSEFVWRGLGDIADAGGYGAFIGHVVYNQDGFDWRSINYDTEYEHIKSVLEPLTSAPSADASGFRARGGKMLAYHGWNDPIVTPNHSPNYYTALALMERHGNGRGIDRVIENLTPAQAAAAALSARTVQDHFRLFMVPGMSHCGGGNGPNAFGQNLGAPAAVADADHDALLALMRWVEEGIAPERIIATQYVNNNPANGIARQRPLCVYPTVARYKGQGDIDEASSFECIKPKLQDVMPKEIDMLQIRNALNLRGLLSPSVQ